MCCWLLTGETVLRVWLLLWLLFLKNLTGPSGYCMVDHYVSNLGTDPRIFEGLVPRLLCKGEYKAK